MAIPLSTRIAGLLPHDVARGMYRVIRPDRYARIIERREHVSGSPDEPSLRPFLERRCIFVHIPKCAGLGVTDALFGGVHPGGHYTIAQYRMMFSKEEFDSFFKFTFVRNPWDRVISAYYYLKDGGRIMNDRRMSERFIQPHATFRDFVLNFVTEANIAGAIHFRPQYEFICMSEARPPEVDFIGRFEQLADDFEMVRTRLGLAHGLASSNRGRSRPASYRDSYDGEMIDRVARVYRRDIELFGYDF
jgi:Sulfotransferase family